MSSFWHRDLIDYSAGANSSDAIINGLHYNLTTLKFYNYTLYTNGTLSNNSACYLTLQNVPQFTLLENGTFVNGTSCYMPYYGMGKRGSLGIVFACLFAASIMFTLANLRKHGRLFLPNEKRFQAVGRRWQWYWMLFVAASGIISCTSAVDVDSDYLQSIPIIIQGFFFYLTIPGILATVWEGVRHWGSWQERQIYDHDPFSLPQKDRRSRKEFYMPLVFYLFAWLNFFMNVPRSWTLIEKQGSLQQIDTEAKPTSTDTRFKAAAFLAFLGWCMICYNLQHSIHYYKPKNHGPIKSLVGFLSHTPTKFMLTIPLLGISVGYAIASAFIWEINPLKFDGNAGWIYGLGYAPVVLILLVNEIWGVLDPNEDRALLKLRTERGRSIDAELGIVGAKKPPWWSKISGDHHLTTEQRLKALTTEIGGGRATSRNIERTIEMGNMTIRDEHGNTVKIGRDNEEEEQEEEDEDGFAKTGPSVDKYVVANVFRDDVSGISSDRRPVLQAKDVGDSSDGGSSGRASQMTVSTMGGRQQVVRSMLDI